MSRNSYKELSNHYQQILELFDVVHFNSTITEGVYSKYANIDSSKLIPITDRNIDDNRRERHFQSPKLRLIFIGNTTTYKGFPMLESALIELYNGGVVDWKLEVWGATGRSECEAVEYRGDYHFDQLAELYKDDALLITPSLCNETFSLVTLEAISYGIPVLVSSTVGAKDIVGRCDGWFVFKDRVDLKSKLLELIEDRSKLCKFNRAIHALEWNYSLANHVAEIMKIYR